MANDIKSSAECLKAVDILFEELKNAKRSLMNSETCTVNRAVMQAQLEYLKENLPDTVETAAAIVRKNLAGHDLDTLNSFCSVTTGHSGNSDSIVVDSGDRAGHMGAMFIGSDIIALRYEIVTGRYIDVSSQIFMIELDTAVDDGDND